MERVSLFPFIRFTVIFFVRRENRKIAGRMLTVREITRSHSSIFILFYSYFFLDCLSGESLISCSIADPTNTYTAGIAQWQCAKDGEEKSLPSIEEDATKKQFQSQV